MHLLTIAILVGPLGQVGTDSAQVEAAEAAKRLEFMRERLARYEIRGDSGQNGLFQFGENTVLRWSNPVSGVIDGTVFVWTVDGRPEIVAKCFINSKAPAWSQAVQSLSSIPFTMRLNGQAVWKPSRAGIRLRPVPRAPTPAKSKNFRLAQMRTMAREFHVTDTWKQFGLVEVTPWELRLLPRPLVRYESPDRDILDGALFAFVQGTNPEAILLVEARTEESGDSWQYAFARLTIYALDGGINGNTVWSVPRISPQQSDHRETFFRGWHVFSEYPFSLKHASPD